MIFSELYGAYYNTVAAVLRKAVQRPLTKEDLRTVIERCAFSESVLSIEPALTSEKWQLLRPDGTTPLLHPPTMPLTVLQKRWLKAISLDPRIRLFDFDSSGLEDVRRCSRRTTFTFLTGMRTATHLKMRYTYKSSIGYWTRSKSGIRSVLM